MQPTAHAIDIEDDGRIKITFTVDNRQNFSFVFTTEQAALLNNDLATALDEYGEDGEEIAET